MVESSSELKRMLTESLAKAKEINPDRDTNPAQSLEEFYDFVEWSQTTLPRFILKLPTGASLYDHMDQGVDYFYFLLDQPLPELEGKGYYHNSLQYHEPIRSWIVSYCKKWGEFLSKPESWKGEYAKDFYSDPVFGVTENWYEDSSNWKTFNDFFARRLRDASVRPVASPEDDGLMTSPVDGFPQGVWKIDGEGYIQQSVLLKSKYFDSVADLVGPGSSYREAFRGGTLTHVFLDVNDYHRYHFPLSGKVVEMRVVPAMDASGGVYRWNPETGRYWLESRNPGWETVETRACVILDTPEYGPVALMPIGMSQICSVNFADGLKVGDAVKKGQELGYFLFGGSDFVMIFGEGVELELLAEADGEGGYRHIQMGMPLCKLRKG